ncbi:hypothetical protein JT358_16305 [Micrococcales bacterium 31B]|nr:hypothetical protein [Micrococcales bacterium 31B]
MSTTRVQSGPRRACTSDRGAITVETALTASVVVFLLAILAAFGGAALAQIRVGETARIVARAVAAGESPAAAEQRGRINSPAAQVTIAISGDVATVTVRESVDGVGAILTRGTWTVQGRANTWLESALTGESR